MKIQDIAREVEANYKTNSAWKRGVKTYALEIMDDFLGEEVKDRGELQTLLLNGADNWFQYSYGGCSLLTDSVIAKRLCTPSQLRRNKDGRLPPNSQESWLKVQVRALENAWKVIAGAFKSLERRYETI